MVRFELGKEIEKDGITSVGQNKIFLRGPWGIEPQTFGFRCSTMFLSFFFFPMYFFFRSYSIYKHDAIEIANLAVVI